MSNFNFCPLAWHYCGKKSTVKLENIQKRALRFIYNDYKSNYNTLLNKSKLPTLEIRRLRTIAIETFKIIKKKSPMYLHDLIKLKNSHYSFRYENIVDVPRVKTTRYGLNSFRFGAARLWNSLPENIRKEQNFDRFRSLVASWDGGVVAVPVAIR